MEVLIITLSDRASNNEYEDKSGPLIADLLLEGNQDIEIQHVIIPDEEIQFKNLLDQFIGKVSLIISTGSTGIAPRDIAPEVMQPLLEKEIPGIMELIRVKYAMNNTMASLSRGVAGISKNTILFSLPGSPKAVKEYMNEIVPILGHMLSQVQDINDEIH